MAATERLPTPTTYGLRDGGRVASTSTIETVARIPVVAVHAASNAAVEQFTAASPVSSAPAGPPVDSVFLGASDTDLLRGNNPGVDVDAAFASVTGLARLGGPDDTADVVAFRVGPRQALDDRSEPARQRRPP